MNQENITEILVDRQSPVTMEDYWKDKGGEPEFLLELTFSGGRETPEGVVNIMPDPHIRVYFDEESRKYDVLFYILIPSKFVYAGMRTGPDLRAFMEDVIDTFETDIEGVSSMEVDYYDAKYTGMVSALEKKVEKLVE